MPGQDTDTIHRTAVAGPPPPADKNEYDFQFVEVGGQRRQDEDARSVIRAHVMRDFYGRRREGKEPGAQAEIRSAASSQRGVSQQARRFRNGPQGLQEVAKKRMRHGSGPHKPEPSLPLDATCSATRVKISAISSVGNPSAQSDDGESTPFTLSGKFGAQLHRDPGDGAQGQDKTGDPGTRDARSNSLVSTLGSWDPFEALPMRSDARTRILIYHANNGILSSPLMGQLRAEWLSLATKDLAMFHICLSHYAGNYGHDQQECDPTEALRFRMISMKLVNERLDDLRTSLADETMGTVAALSSYEATNGSLTAVQTHLNGIKKMVKLRGGMRESGMNSYTARLVFWADLNCANALACDPTFPIPGYPETRACAKARQAQRCSPRDAWLQAGNVGALVELQRLGTNMIDKFIDLRNLADISSLPSRRELVLKDEQIWRSDEVYFTERSLLTLSNQLGPRDLVPCCCVAAIIFIDNHLRGIAFIARIMTRHVARLKLLMEIFLADDPNFAARSITPQAILWILYVGGIVAGNSEERGWFVVKLLEFCDVLNLHCWKDAEGILKQFLWPITWDLEGILVWEYVEDARSIRLDPHTGVTNTLELDFDPYKTLL